MLRRTIYWIAVPAMLLLAFRVFWGWQAERRLEASVARLGAMKVRMSPEEFPEGAEVPAGQNAVAVLLSGPVTFATTRAQDSLITAAVEYQSAAEKDAVGKLLAAHQDLLDRIDAAQSCRQVVWPRWGIDPGHHPALTGLVNFGRLLLKAARLAHEQHDEALALRHLGRLMTVAHVFEHSPFFIDSLLALVFRDFAAQGVDAMEPGLALQEPAAAAAARALIASLLDDAAVQPGMAMAVEWELTRQVTYSDHFRRIQLGLLGEADWALRPWAAGTWTQVLDQYAAVIAALRAPNWPQYVPLAARIPVPLRRPNLMEAMVYMGRLNSPNLAGRYEAMLERLVHSRAAALLLAARLYGAEHDSLPKSSADLGTLVGGRIPVDPFVEGDMPLHFRLDAAGPSVWSTGKDARDDGGIWPRDIVYGAANPPAVPPVPAPPRAPAPLRVATTRAAVTRPASRPAP